MTGVRETVQLPWPADPGSAWAEAVQSPDRIVRLSDPPEVDSADAASIADWIQDRRSLLPMLAVVIGAVGLILVGGLLIGVLPLPAPGGTSAAVQWKAGMGLLMASVVLWIWEALRRRKRRSAPPREAPPARMVLCELHPTRFAIHDGDGYRDTCVAIAADTSDVQAARIRTAFRIWLTRLRADADAASRARNELWQPSGANVFAAEEIFGPDAAGGYLVRRPNSPAHGWGVLLTARRPAKIVGQLRFADVLRWNGSRWSL